jgi:glycosyltransferase involved in cell wall biosynthesis
MKPHFPLVTVIIPVYKFDSYVLLAIKSIQHQSYDNIEIIIIDDSNDNSLDDEIKKLLDKRIKCIKGNKRGLSDALNIGIENSIGKYIVRMDSDDISMPYRIEQQYKYLKENDLDICGTNIKFFGVSNEEVYFPEFDNEIKFALLFGCPIAHPTVMVKSEILKENKYNFETTAAEDYELWIKLSIKGYRFGICQSFLLKYRTHANQASKKNLHQLENSILFAMQYASVYLNSEIAVKFQNFDCGFSKKYNTSEVKEILNILRLECVRRDISSKIYSRLLVSLYFRITDYSWKTIENFKYDVENTAGIKGRKKMLTYLYFRSVLKNSIPDFFIKALKNVNKRLPK